MALRWTSMLLRLMLVVGLCGCVPKEQRVQAEPPPIYETKDGRNEVRLQIADVLLDHGDGAEAQKVIQLAEDEGADPDVIKLYRGRAMYVDGMVAEAEPLLQQAHKAMPHDPRPVKYLALIAADDGRIDDAIALCRVLVKVDPADASGWNNLGFLLMSQEKYDDASQALTEAVSRDGTNPRYSVNLGFALFGSGHPADALQAFRAAGDEADAQSNLALAYEMAGKQDDAVVHYRKALAADPHSETASKALDRIQTESLPETAPSETP
jgi:Flp pilus assembly protein TadD